MDKAVVDEFTTFVRERSHALMGTAYALCGNQHDAEDLVQNALAKAYVPSRRGTTALGFMPSPVTGPSVR